jgi:hypothetical protein
MYCRALPITRILDPAHEERRNEHHLGSEETDRDDQECPVVGFSRLAENEVVDVDWAKTALDRLHPGKAVRTRHRLNRERT